MQEEIKKRIIDHLTDCGGNALIIFDEMQMFADGSFDTLQSGLQKGGLLKLESGVTISTENVIFLFITDAGADKFQELIASYGGRNKIPQSVIRSAARSALVDHMGDSNIVELISKVIPYMPMENSQIQDLLRMKIRKLPYVLNVDDSAVEHMSSPSFVDYVSVSTSSSDEMVSGYKSFALLGGRAITNGERKVIKIAVLQHALYLAVLNYKYFFVRELFLTISLISGVKHHYLNEGLFLSNLRSEKSTFSCDKFSSSHRTSSRPYSIDIATHAFG